MVIPRIKSDLLNLLKGIGDGTFSEKDLEIENKATATVILASNGYPEKYEKDKLINGLEIIENSLVFHAGTKKEDENILTNGGRVLAVTSYGKDIKEALKISYSSVDNISFENKYFRKDIGFDL